MGFEAPEIAYGALAPMLLVLGAAVVGVAVEAFSPRGLRRIAQLVLTTGALLAALVATVVVGTGLEEVGGGLARGLTTASGTVTVDGPAVVLWALILIFALGGVLLFSERRLDGGVSAFSGQAASLPGTSAEREASTRGLEHTEVYPLLLFAVGGMMLFPASADLLTMFVALEVLSLPLYLLCGLARKRRLLSQEAAMKYFLLGAFSSGFFLYGMALVYGYAGSLRLAEIAVAIRMEMGDTPLLLIGLGLLAVGLLFKVGAVPFHNWTPDVYQGAPTAVTAFMAAATKVAAIGALLRLLYVAFGADTAAWEPMLWVVAMATMLVGSVLAVVQDDVKRMLAYSSIAHTGFMLTGVLGVRAVADYGPGELTSTQAVLFYLATYGLATIGAFAVVTVVRDASGESTRLETWAGLGRRSPLMAAIFGLFLLSMAGIPLTAGFVGKWAVFAAAFAAGAWPVVVVAVAASVIAVFFYVRVILVMFFAEPPRAAEAEATAEAGGTADTGSTAGTGDPGYGGTATVVGTEAGAEVATASKPSVQTTATILVTAAATLVLGVVPGPLLDLIGHAGQFIR